MRFLIPLLLLGAVAAAIPEPAAAQIEGKSMSYGRIRCDSFGPESTCPIDTSRGVRLVREFSRNRCAQGRTWGWDPYRIWVRDGCQAEFEIGRGGPGGGIGGREVVCESRNNRIEYCPADTRGGVALVEQLSNARCIRDRTWGFDRQSIWVRDGCRARFELGSSGGGWQPPPPPPPPQAGRSFRCESQRGRREYCAVPMGNGYPVLVRNLSNTPCDLQRNWGWDRGGVWVDDGCRGEFRIEFGGNPGGGWGGQGGGQQVQTLRCESRDGRMQFCNADTSGFVRMTRALSKADCLEGYSFGWDHTGIWVNHGCRAEFEIRPRY